MPVPEGYLNAPSLAIVGASARAAAASARRAGFQPITADLFADADLRRISTATRISPYPDGLVDWIRAVEPPAWMYTGALENQPELIDQMAWIAPLWGNPGDVLTRVRSPWELATVLRNHGLLFPETRATAEGLPHDGTWLAKTYHGASGSGVRELGQTGRQGDRETRSNVLSGSEHESPCLPVSSPGPVYQRRISGTPCAAVFIASGDGAALLGVTRQLVGESWLGARGFQYSGSIGPLPLSESARATVEKIGRVLTREFELIGLFGVDMIVDGHEVWTLEVNPRYTASVEIVERFSGVSAIAAHAAACAAGLGAGGWGLESKSFPSLQSPASSPLHHGKAILYAKGDIVIPAEFAALTLAEAVRTPWPTLADISPAGTPIEAGRPILTMFAEGKSPDDVEARLRERAGELESEIYRLQRH